MTAIHAEQARPVVGRSMVATRYGIVASSQPLAARAGVQILERGGNAVDAAIAANATIGLMEPTGNGIGGDLFALVYEAKTGKLYGLNASGWAPSGLTPEFLRVERRRPHPDGRGGRRGRDRDAAERRLQRHRAGRRRRLGRAARQVREAAVQGRCSRRPSSMRRKDSPSPR